MQQRQHCQRTRNVCTKLGFIPRRACGEDDDDGAGRGPVKVPWWCAWGVYAEARVQKKRRRGAVGRRRGFGGTVGQCPPEVQDEGPLFRVVLRKLHGQDVGVCRPVSAADHGQPRQHAVRDNICHHGVQIFPSVSAFTFNSSSSSSLVPLYFIQDVSLFNPSPVLHRWLSSFFFSTPPPPSLLLMYISLFTHIQLLHESIFLVHIPVRKHRHITRSHRPYTLTPSPLDSLGAQTSSSDRLSDMWYKSLADDARFRSRW
jgi:hypothetical protein